MSIYALKPNFQNLLRPLVRQLAAKGVTAKSSYANCLLTFYFTRCGSCTISDHFLLFSSLSLFGCFCVWR